jgi:predicted Zn-dependent peptidase
MDAIKYPKPHFYMKFFSRYVFLFSWLSLVPVFSKIQVEHHRLDNGLEVLLYPQNFTPTVTCRLFFTTGSVHEGPGRTGIAHVLEHMLFKGTKRVGITDSTVDKHYLTRIDSLLNLKWSLEKGLRPRIPLETLSRKDSLRIQEQIDQVESEYQYTLDKYRNFFIKDELWGAYLQAGGTGLNAFTSDLMTAYFVTLPKNKVELFLWLEADRMQHGVLREFYPERDVVLEERRMRYEDSPYGRYFETLNSLFYEASPLRLPTIGYASDLNHLTRKQAEEHYQKYYKPNNAILVLVGDFDPAMTLKQIKKYFGTIPKGKEHAEIVTRDPEPIGEKRLTVYKQDAKPRLDLFFKTPGLPNQDLYALSVVEGVLSGKSGRLYRKLVTEKKLALSVSARNSMEKFHSSFHIGVQLGTDIGSDSQSSKIRDIEKTIWEVLKDLSENPITARELQRVKNQVAMNSLQSLRNKEHLATELAFYQMWGTWKYINIIPDEISKVTPRQVQQVSQKYFSKKRSTVGLVLPEYELKQ